MAGRLFLYNPENDIALASGLPRITPPRQASDIHLSGALLPVWLAGEGDYVLVKDATKTPAPLREYLHGVNLIESANGMIIKELSPWGWSNDVCAQFRAAGVEESLIRPHQKMMETHRRLSHRASSLALLQLLKDAKIDMPERMPVQAKTLNEVVVAVNDFGRAYLKSPWSCSGRGVFPVSTESLKSSLRRMEGIIARQGSVMVEPALNRIADFAMLFNYTGAARASFVGYSMTLASPTGRYSGNIVASDDAIEQTLTQMVPLSALRAVRKAVAEALPALLGGNYNGPLGVDMMVYSDKSGRNRIAPCVEMNLRYTMGFVARGIYDRIGREGELLMGADHIDVEGHTTPLSADILPLAPDGAPFGVYFRSRI